MSLGQYIRDLREARDLLLREFAREIGCSAHFISDVELGRRFPSEKLLKEIAGFFGVKVEELKKRDTRPPVEEIKERIASDPLYALAFRTVADSKITAQQLLKFAHAHGANKKKPK